MAMVFFFFLSRIFVLIIIPDPFSSPVLFFLFFVFLFMFLSYLRICTEERTIAAVVIIWTVLCCFFCCFFTIAIAIALATCRPVDL
ncbi:hypothetical protein DFH27DRAFT_111552 [Peziza echinospora]|nr:hypothetical protein DFH27DRAFT_111552 [Peziza echinospora]